MLLRVGAGAVGRLWRARTAYQVREVGCTRPTGWPPVGGRARPHSGSRPRSTIQIRPNVQWPTLDDNNQEVERFYYEFEGICQLANDSSGMSYAEMFLTIGNCLKGARKNTYEVVGDQGRLSGDCPMQADILYHRLKERLLEFRESRLER